MTLKPRVLLATPPMSDLNTPYPATCYLTAFLRSRKYAAFQVDWSIGLACRLFSKSGLDRLRNALADSGAASSVTFFLNNFDRYRFVIESLVAFLQGRDDSAKFKILNRRWLPEGPRLSMALDRPSTLGPDSVDDIAKFFASAALLDVADAVTAAEPRFELVRYGEGLARSQTSFDPMFAELNRPSPLIDPLIEDLVAVSLAQFEPDLLGLSVPFPGNLYGALSAARVARRLRPSIHVVLGGGFVNTELRDLGDARVFDFVHEITLDDGFRPLECILEVVAGDRPPDRLVRTLRRVNGAVCRVDSPNETDLPFSEWPAPTYDGLNLRDYLGITHGTTRVHRVWASHWNKLTLAHGCYWKKCAFCDIELDYISRYEAQKAVVLADQIEHLVAETGYTGFHWVDEAAPPAVLRALSAELVRRGVSISWWSHVRFDRAFTEELTRELANAGCVMVAGGIEVASDRVLKLMKKGITVEQVAAVTKNFVDAGVLVHAFLMYGFPTQTSQETIDSLEVVRQLFAAGCLTSAFWHRFVATPYSPVGRSPEDYGITLEPLDAGPASRAFVTPYVRYSDPALLDHDVFRNGLASAVLAYREGTGLRKPVHKWFDCDVPATKVPRNFIADALRRSRAAVKSGQGRKLVVL